MNPWDLTPQEHATLAQHNASDDEVVAVAKAKYDDYMSRGQMGQPIQPQAAPYDLSTDTGQSPLVRGAVAAINTALPVQAIQEMAGQMGGSRPHDPMALASSAGQLALAAPMFMAGPAGTAARMGAGAAGATAGGLEAMDVENPAARFGLPLLAALAAGHFNAPNTALKAVPKGEEINAIGRQANEMGIPVPKIAAQSMTRTGPAPADIRATWEQTMRPLGKNVGITKQAAMQTTKNTPTVLKTIRQAATSGLEEAGVPRVRNALNPELATEPHAAKLVLDSLNKLGMIPPGTAPEKAMMLANNVLEAAQKTVAESSNYGPNMAGRVAGKGLTGMQEAIDSLGSPEAVAAHQEANQAFSKGKAMQDLVEAATKGKGAGPVPMFRPKDFIAAWQGMDTAQKAKAFSPDEIQAIDSLTQQNPNVIMRGIQFLADKARDWGLKPLTFHPSTRLYEEAPTFAPRAGTVAVAAPAAYRSATYDPSQNRNVQAASNALRLSKMGGR